jgi:IclR family mhp operon transcriptional activator
VRNGAVYGCISIIWIRSALGIEEAMAQFVGPLRDTAEAIPVSP